MLRATWLALALVCGCATNDVRIDDVAAASCDPRDDELLGCCRAGTTCTWAAPVGERCTDEFTSFCDHGSGWCEAGVCRSFCSAVDMPRCEAGTSEQHSTNADLGDADQCLCVPS